MVLVERTELQDLETRVHRGPRTDRDFAVRLAYVVGARPNIVKMAPVLRALRRRLPLAGHVVIHTGQHYDRLMSEVFLDDLGVTGPDQFLGVGSGSHSEQTARHAVPGVRGSPFPASRSGRTPSGRSRSRPARTPCSAWIP